MEDKDYRQLARYMLTRWRYYEMNLSNDNRKIWYIQKGIILFKALKSLTVTEIKYLSDRYYLYPTKKYNDQLSCYETCELLNITALANKYGISQKKTRAIFSGIELKFGKKIKELEGERDKSSKTKSTTSS